MPELPEVETVRRGLEPVMLERRIAKAMINRPDLRWPFPDRMAERLQGARIKNLRRRSKYVLVDLDTEETLIIHLGMSGRILIHGHELGSFVHDLPSIEKHDHVVLDLDDGARIVFNDPRRFGSMDLCQTNKLDRHRLIERLGPEPNGNRFNAVYLYDALQQKRTPIKNALLDQRIIAGLGNIYVCEALWRAGISPQRIAKSLGRARVERLAVAIQDVISDAIDAGGSSLRDYRQTDGELGYFQHQFAVYGREGEACRTPGCKGAVARISQSGRSSFYCKRCQR